MPFVEKNVRADQAAVGELIEELKSYATPTVKIGDEVLIGFDPQAYALALTRIGL